MGFEGPRGRPGGERRQHRSLDFDVTMLVEKATNLAHDFVTQLEHFARRQAGFFAFQFQTSGNQIGITLPLTNLRIVYAMQLVRHRQQGLG